MTTCNTFDMVIFGGAGDLATRKLLPALYHLNKDGQLPGGSRIIGAGRSAMPEGEFAAHVAKACRDYVPEADMDSHALEAFCKRIDYVAVDSSDASQFAELAKTLDKVGDERCRVFFLATKPALFAEICEQLAAAGLNTPNARVVLEKPLGKDLASAQEINARVAKVFGEHQVFRIDHYLGKETVQNLMALRFANTLFEPLWRNTHIRDVQITLAESVGVGGRAGYYDGNGALRDMVQNHLLQLLCITAMEPPINDHADAVRDEKLKVLRALRPLTGQAVLRNTVRGQYKAGAIDGKPVPGYLDEDGIPADSHTESFVVLKTRINNWRWSGVPFFLRTGKRLAERRAEIVVNFKRVPHNIFGSDAGDLAPNRLVIRLQPDEGVRMSVLAKRPGNAMRLRPVNLNLDFAQTFRVRALDAYERLLMEVIRGNLTLFMRNDELEAAWRWIDPIIGAWETEGDRPKAYSAGSWGPSAAISLLAKDGYAWNEEVDDAF